MVLLSVFGEISYLYLFMLKRVAVTVLLGLFPLGLNSCSERDRTAESSAETAESLEEDRIELLKEIAKGDESATRLVNDVINTIFRQNRDRSDAEAQKLIELCFGNVFVDTTKLQDLIYKTDPDSSLCVDSGPELVKLEEERKTLEAARSEYKERCQ